MGCADGFAGERDTQFAHTNWLVLRYVMHHRIQHFPGMCIRIQQLLRREMLPGVAVPVLQNCQQQVFLSPEVVQQSGVADPCAAGNCRHGNATKADLTESVNPGLETFSRTAAVFA